MREDFCGTFALCHEWVKLDPKNIAYGVDLDPEPLAWGMKKYFVPAESDLQRRILPIQANVLDPRLPKADVICALNFSYFFFRKREELKKYFMSCKKHLRPGGILFLDALGGGAYQQANEQKDRMKGFTYFWEQTYFNPIEQHGKFAIHYQRKGEAKRRNVFTYEWRLWGLAELRELLMEVGFKGTRVYWEGSDSSGGGDGKFKITNQGDDAESWIAYLVAY